MTSATAPRQDVPDQLMTPQEAADYLHITIRSFYNLRYLREDFPPAMRVGRHLRYRREGLDAWLATQTEQPGRSVSA